MPPYAFWSHQNAPATFQNLMENCLGDLHLNWCIIYLDDIIVYSKTPEEHLEHLEAVFQKIGKAGLKLKPSKCEFFKSEITYLGHIVSNKGIATDPKKIRAIQRWPRPMTVTEVRKFTGLTNYYSIMTDTPINVYTRFCQSTAKSKFSLVSPVAD